MSKKYTVNAVKTFMGREGYGFNCNLLCNGKKVAFVIDDASGGMINIQWLDYGKERDENRRTPAEAEFCEHIKGKTYTCPFDKEEHEVNDHIFISGLIDQKELEKKMKKRILFVEAGQTDVSNFTGKITLERQRASVPTGATILNDLPIEEAVALL